MVDRKLRKELLTMMKRDQDLRNRMLYKRGKYDENVDRKNTARMKEIIKRYGWPAHKLVGKDGAFAAWLLVQHADMNIAFQKKCLRLLEQAVKEGQADPANLAYLTDRVLVHEGKKQVYGTQFYQDKNRKFGPQPIKGLAKLDARRKSVGLEPFKNYEKRMHRLQHK